MRYGRPRFWLAAAAVVSLGCAASQEPARPRAEAGLRGRLTVDADVEAALRVGMMVPVVLEVTGSRERLRNLRGPDDSIELLAPWFRLHDVQTIAPRSGAPSRDTMFARHQIRWRPPSSKHRPVEAAVAVGYHDGWRWSGPFEVYRAHWPEFGGTVVP